MNKDLYPVDEKLQRGVGTRNKGKAYLARSGSEHAPSKHHPTFFCVTRASRNVPPREKHLRDFLPCVATL